MLAALGLATPAFVLVACDSSSTESEVVLQWSPCDTDSQFECAELEVPMVHDDPDGEKIKLSLNRLPSSSTSKQRSLLFNPGGPG